MKHPFLRTLLLTLAIGALLASCRSTVPQPSKVLDTNSQSKQYQWINNAPLRASDAQSVHFTDLNQDGFIDLLLGISNGTSGFQVKWGDGTGNWTSQSGPPTAMQPLSFATADINHDQNIDILIGGKGGLKGLQIWELHPDKKTWKLHSSPTTTGVFSTVKFADINNDGWSDIIATRLDSNENGGVFVLLNDGKNGWVSGTGPVAKGLFTGLSVEDINNDGNMDIVTSRRGGLGAIEGDDEVWKQVGGIQLWYGDGNGRWQPAELPASSDAESLVVADMNGDGNLDIISGLYQAGITIWWNNNSAWDKEQIMTTGTWSDIHVADLDADGKRELVASSSVGQGLQVWRWQGGNFKKDNNLVPSFGVYLDLDLGDIRNDGTLAIAATRAGAGLEIWSSTKPNPLPIQQSIAKKVGSLLSIYFDSGKALLTSDAEKSLETWLKTLNSNIIDLHLELQGHAGQRHIHSELYPNNLSLSQARAESVAAWLVNHGVSSKQITIKALGDGHPISTGATPDALKKNRRVLMQAYQVRTARLPLSTASLEQTDLYQVTENKVFKTIGGIPEYKVGPGDELSITFWQGSKADVKKVIVQVDGTVSLPYQSALNVAEKTPREIDALITDILQQFERTPRVDVQLLKARSKKASIFGEINSLSRQPTGPGIYNLQGKENLVDFLSRAGGPGKEANLNSVQITRDGKTIILDLNRAIRLGDMSENAIIDDGDTIFVPSIKQSKRQIYVLGEVQKTGIVEFTDSINFLDALSKSGGLTPDAYLPDIRVLRANREQPEILAVDFERFMEHGDLSQNIALLDKDIIIIPARPIANWNKYIQDISPSVTLLLQPVSLAQQLLTLQVLSGQLK